MFFLSHWICMAAARTVWFSFHLGCHRSAVSLSLKCFSDSDNCPNVGIGTLLQFPEPAEGMSSPPNTPVSPPTSSSYRVLRGFIYSFPLVRYSCLLLAGVLHALLCLKVYSWCIHGERCFSRPPTPLPSCSPTLSCSFLFQLIFVCFLISCLCNLL